MAPWVALASALLSSPIETAAVPPRALVRDEAPEYPRAALLTRTTGEVRCRLLITAAGLVKGVSFGGDSEIAFQMEVKRVLPELRFSPAPAESVLEFIWHFVLEPVVESRGSATEQLNVEVLEAGKRSAVAGALVIAVGPGTGGFTDAKGRLSLSLTPGLANLLVWAPEHAFLQSKALVERDGDHQLTVYLYRKGPGELSATVEGQHKRDAPSKTQISSEEARNVPGTREDPLRVIEMLPGVARAPFRGGQLIVRGARAVDTGAYLDGLRIPLLYHLENGPSVLGEQLVERIDFLAGGAGAFYGRQLAGVVAVQPSRGDPEFLHGSLGADLAKSSASLAGPLGATTQFTLGGRISYLNPVIEFMADPKKPFEVPLFGDYQGSLRHKLSGGGELALLLFGSRDSFTTVGQGRGLEQALSARSVEFHRAQLQLRTPLGRDFTLSVAPFAGLDRSNSHQFGLGSDSGLDLQSARGTSWGLRSELTWKTAAWLEVRLGVDQEFDRIRYTYDRNLGGPLVASGAFAQFAGGGLRTLGAFGQYLQGEFSLGNLRLTPGLRIDLFHWSGHTQAALDPRLWARLAVAPLGDLFAYAGLYHQAPQVEELDPKVGNPALSPESAQQIGVGIERRFAGVWSIRVETFYQRRSGLVASAVARASDDGTISNPLQLNSGIGRSVGVEFLFRRELSSWLYGWIAYTLARSEELLRPGEQWQPGPYDQRHVLTLLLGMRPSQQVEFSVRLRFASGNPQRAVLGTVFDSAANAFVAVTGPVGSTHLPSFAQLDFEVNNLWIADTYKLTLYIDLQNLLNQATVEGLVYDYRYVQSSPLPGVPFSANLGARVTF